MWEPAARRPASLRPAFDHQQAAVERHLRVIAIRQCDVEFFSDQRREATVDEHVGIEKDNRRVTGVIADIVDL